ncbi:flagellar hook-basal body complex protein FliE [Borrelia sp. BU AG58]|uniref:flagellar hook-basal body complex protein FliE n=1 Tax=Borrelia sp. BU AG58 TaxID=2887345 RepID=UPI001E4CFCD9|nr:flagellar hook-basal body complex protein FliE [Borrelia sp. BU AG58]UER67481.1 flagellar hook-basal body complex protein FliE [Borrelia sp. BU AG58]
MRVDSFFMDNGFYLVGGDPLHFKLNSIDLSPVGKDLPKSFKDVFLDAISRVNDSQLDVSRMTERAIVEPDKIDVHDVVIAMAKANMNLSITKAVVERSIRAYQDIINIR